MQKNFFYQGIGLIFSGLILIGLLVFKFDPFQQFKINKYGRGDQRILNPGIAKNYDYQIAVIGTSTSENILKKDLEKTFNKKAVNLSLAGSSNYEQRKLLELILKTKKADTIIYGLDIFSYNRELNESRVELQKFAYTDSKIEKLKYLYNFEVLKNILKGIISGGDVNWLNKHSYWGDDYSYSKDRALSFDSELQWGAQNIGVIEIFKQGYSYKRMKNNFDEFYKLIESNQQIKYKIYFPPYASVWWYFAKKYDCLEDILKFKAYVIKKLKHNSNIQIYDFQSIEEITENLDNYKDIVHYAPTINKEIINMIKENKSLVIEEYDIINEMEKKNKYLKLLENKYQLKELNI